MEHKLNKIFEDNYHAGKGPDLNLLPKEELIPLVVQLKTELEKHKGRSFLNWLFGRRHKEKTDAAKKLEESEQKYRFLFENAPVGIFRSSSQGKLIEANPILAKILKYNSVSEMLDSIDDLSKFYADPKRRPELINKLKESGDVENFEFEVVISKGIRLWLSMNARISQILGPNDFIIEGFIADITEKKNFELQILKQNDELKELNATKDKFFSIIAHDLRNPFNGMMALSMLLLKNFDEYETGQIKEIVDLINQSAERGVRLLENLLEWSRAQTGNIVYTPEIFDLAGLVDESISLLATVASKKKIKVHSSVPPDVQVYADKNMVFTVLRNLISNSIKFTFKDGEVDVKADVENDKESVKVTVSDNGTGIMPEHQKLLFKLGQNFSIKGTANESGTGLGLIICKEFVEKNGGKIWLKSEYEKGSDFIFTVPLPKEDQV
jgi:PAS domain S-box-containing protein